MDSIEDTHFCQEYQGSAFAFSVSQISEARIPSTDLHIASNSNFHRFIKVLSASFLHSEVAIFFLLVSFFEVIQQSFHSLILVAVDGFCLYTYYYCVYPMVIFNFRDPIYMYLLEFSCKS